MAGHMEVALREYAALITYYPGQESAQPICAASSIDRPDHGGAQPLRGDLQSHRLWPAPSILGAATMVQACQTRQLAA